MSEGPQPTPLGSPELLEAIRQAVAHAGLGLAVTLVGEPAPRNIHLNPAAEELLGRSAGEVARIGVWSCLAPEALPALEDQRRRRLGGEPVPDKYETIVLRPDGERVPVEIAHAETMVGQQRVVVSFLFDLRPRIEALKAIAESERRFRTVVENAPDGVAILRGPSIMFLNRRAADLLGLDHPSAGYGRRITEFLHPEDAQRAAERIAKIFRERKPFAEPSEYRSRSTTGRELTVEISSIPIELDGQPAVLAFARDATERKAISERLVQADRLAALAVLSAGVAHEVNNPLAYVLLNLEYLEREIEKLDLTPDKIRSLKDRARDARHGAERVASIVRDLKTFARADDGGRGAVQVAPILDGALKLAIAEIEQRARLIRAYEDVPPAAASHNRLEQVFVNLLLNAAQSITEGKPEENSIRVGIKPRGAHLAVEIEDTGEGMSEATQKLIFDPFFTTKPPGVGTGLGLPICQSIVRALGGDITVESQLGRGSRFTVLIPLWQGEAAELKPGSGSSREVPRGRVMIVDDEAAVGRTLRLILDRDHDVILVTSAEEALERLTASDPEEFDAILCDLVMPGMTGIELLQTIKARSEKLAERVIFMTGGLSSRPGQNVTHLPNVLLEKPFDLERLRSALKNAVMARLS